MAIIKCKMCGGDLNLMEDASIAECEFCGSVQTVPKVDDEKKLTLFARANRLRAACEFDKAAGVYEALVGEFPEEAEAYWGLVLCKYGIEYVDDPATGKKIPTCHRAGFESIMDDSDLEQALENADVMARRVYREEAKAIEELRKGILAVSGKEEPYDIFICYKESDEKGERTLDSVLAQDIYDALTEKGYRVFFSRITLEDKLGQKYEPYIFAALNSAKIMLAVGTDYEYYNAVWVKNEWSRYLKLMAKDREKHLIPCYKGIDAYDMPKEFSKLQAQDLGKVGATQDLLRGIEKLLPREKTEVVRETVSAPASASVSSMVTRGQFALDDGDWSKAEEYFDRALDMDPRDGEAYLGKAMAAWQIKDVQQIGEFIIDLAQNKDFMRAMQFVSADRKKELEEIKEKIERKLQTAKLISVLKSEVKKQQDEAEKKAEEARRQAEEEERKAACARLAAKLDQKEEARIFEIFAKKDEALSALQIRDSVRPKIKKTQSILENMVRANRIEKICDKNTTKYCRCGYEERQSYRLKICEINEKIQRLERADQEKLPEEIEADKMKERINQATIEQKSVSIFNRKEKKRLQEEIDSLTMRRCEMEKKIAEKKAQQKNQRLKEIQTLVEERAKIEDLLENEKKKS